MWPHISSCGSSTISLAFKIGLLRMSSQTWLGTWVVTLKFRTSLSPLSSTGAGLSGPHLPAPPPYSEICQCRERGDPGAGDRAQVITRTKQARCRDILGRTVALGPVWEGGREGSRHWQPARSPCHPQQEGGGDKRAELSGSWNTERRG